MAKLPGGYLIREARKARKQQVEDAAPHLDVSPGTLRGIENGRVYAGPDTIRKICDYYNLNEQELLTPPERVEPVRIDRTVPLAERSFLLAEEAAGEVDVPYMTIIRAIDKGNGPLQAAKVGREWRIHRPELERWFTWLVEQTRQSA